MMRCPLVANTDKQLLHKHPEEIGRQHKIDKHSRDIIHGRYKGPCGNCRIYIDLIKHQGKEIGRASCRERV